MKLLAFLFPILLMAQAPATTEPAQKPAATGAKPAETARTPSAAELMKASLDRQKAAMTVQVNAARQQAAATGATMSPWAPPAMPRVPGADCDPIAAAVVEPMIEDAAKKNSIGVKLVRAVIEQESGFKPCAVSVKGAQGLMQLMPDTADSLNVSDAMDPAQNIAGGARYLKQLLDHYSGDTKLALAAYNAGPMAVDTSAGIPDIPETRQYVESILKKIQ